MQDVNNFQQVAAQNYIDAMNDKIASVIINKINLLVDLDKVIADDLANRKAQYEESKAKLLEDGSENWKEIASKMVEPTLEFKDVTTKLTYAFQVLLSKGYTFTHDILGNGEVVIKFFKIEQEYRFILDTKYSVGISEITK